MKASLEAPDIERYIKPRVSSRGKERAFFVPMIMNSQSSNVQQINGSGNGKYSDTAQIVGDPNVTRLFYDRDDATVQHLEDCESLEPYLKVCLKDVVSPTVLRSLISQPSLIVPIQCVPESESTRTTTTRHVTRREKQHPPDTCTSQSSSLDVNASITDKDNDDPPFVLADRASGVLFSSGLITASGTHVTAQEFRKAPRALAPTLHLFIPSGSPAPTKELPASSKEAEEERDGTSCPSAPLPSFALTLASPVTSPRSPIHAPHPPDKPFTHVSYYAQVARARAPPSSTRRVPYLPQYCTHTLRPFIPLTNCPLCAIQLLACETWYNSRNTHTNTHTYTHADTHAPPPPLSKNRESRSKMTMAMVMLRAPQVLPADCTPTTRAIFYALGLPLGKLDESCVDWDVVDTIMFIPSCPSPRRGSSKKATAAVRRSSSSRIHLLFRRARHFFGTPARALVTRAPTLAIVRP